MPQAQADDFQSMENILFILYPLALIAPRLVLPALGLHAALIAQTAVRYGRVPLIGLHETLGFLALAVGLIYGIAGWNRKRDLFTSLTITMILLLLAGSHLSPSMGGPLPPVLKTIWFELHVILSFIAYALFAIGAFFGIHAQYGDEQSSDEIKQYRSLLLGYVLFSCAMIFGGIWAYYAWGTYWLWTPKELWTTIIWLYYSLYLHARLVRGWSGTKVTWMGTIGFAIVMFTYVGVGLLMKSSHEF